jgi:hypothetical protein
MWDLWWKKWHWLFPEYFGFLLSISSHRCSIKMEKYKKKNLIIFIRVAQQASGLRCVYSICRGTLQ